MTEKNPKADKEKKEEKVATPHVKELDLFLPSEFGQALQAKIPRPFIFGPIEFGDLNLREEEYPFPHA